MRKIRKWKGLSWIASCAVHALVVACAYKVYESWSHNTPKEEPSCDRVVHEDSYPNVAVTFDYPVSLSLTSAQPIPSRNKVEPPWLKRRPDAQIQSQALAQPAAMAGQATNEDEHSSGKHGNEKIIPPLHGHLAQQNASIVYVLDKSSSMAIGGKFAYAIAMLKKSLQQLDVKVRFQIVSYDSKATITHIGGNLELVTATEAHRAEAEKCLDELDAEGSSRHYEGIRAGLSLHPTVLILLTDAGELTPREAAHIQQWNRGVTDIHVVLLSQTQADASWEAVTSRNKIHHFVVEDRLHTQTRAGH